MCIVKGNVNVTASEIIAKSLAPSPETRGSVNVITVAHRECASSRRATLRSLFIHYSYPRTREMRFRQENARANEAADSLSCCNAATAPRNLARACRIPVCAAALAATWPRMHRAARCIYKTGSKLRRSQHVRGTRMHGHV